MDMNLAVTNKFHIAFYAAALTISFTTLLFTLMQKRTDRLQNKLYIIMVMIIVCNTTTGIVTAIAEPFAYDSEDAFRVLDTGQFLYFLLHTALCPILYYYVISVTGEIRKRSMVANLIYAIPFIVTECLALLNPIIRCVYYYDSDLGFHRNWAEYLIYGAAALYFFMGMIRLMMGWNAITLRRRIALLYFFSISLAGIIIQLVNIEIKSELFAEALALMGLMIAVESEDDRIDADTGIYNRKAMQMDIHNYFMMNERYAELFILYNFVSFFSIIFGSIKFAKVFFLGIFYFLSLIK